jgi:hypothetical protein
MDKTRGVGLSLGIMVGLVRHQFMMTLMMAPHRKT